MAIFYPHKQTVIIAIVCALIVGGAAYSAFNSSRNSGSSAEKVVTAENNVAPEKIPDNGWQNQFLTASSAAFNTATSKQNSSSADTSTKLTTTAIFGEDFFSKVMQVRQAGLTNDPDTMNAVGDQLINDSLGSISPPAPLSLSDIHIVTTATQGSLQAYASTVSDILSSYIPDQDHNEATIAEQALEGGNMDELGNLDPIIANYKTALKTLATMPVPKPLASYHLDLMNGINISLFNAESLRHVDDDPMKGLAAVGMEVQGLQYIDNAVSEIKQYLSTYNITFG